tara:strand:+ start:2437 stop:6579 length:4143 start_codon:yes stop_codon:yes gene_type:complete
MDILATSRREKPHMNIKEYMKRAISDPECELEFVYGDNPRNGRLSKTQFTDTLNYLRQNFKSQADSTTLDIQLHYTKLGTVWSAQHERWESVKKGTGISSIRCTIEGVENIRRYCKSNSIDGLANVSFMKKEIYDDPKFESLVFDSIKNTDYNFRINLKKEIPIHPTSEEAMAMKEMLPTSLKYYRYKKRFSFFTEDGLFRIDLTAIKQNLYNRKTKSYNLHKDLVNSKILKQNETFEIEIEYIGSEMIDGDSAIDAFAKKYHVPAFDDEDEKAYAEQLKITSQDLLQPSLDAVIGTSDTELPVWPEWSGETVTSAEQQTTTITPYAKASSLKGAYHSRGRNVQDKDKKWAGHLDRVLLTYWFSCDRNPLYLALLEFEKALIFDNVLVNHTASYDKAPKHANYVRYIIQPPFTEEEIIKIQEVYPFQEKITSLPEVLEVPFSEIDELREYEETYTSTAEQYSFFEPEEEDTSEDTSEASGSGSTAGSSEPQPEENPESEASGASQSGGGDKGLPSWAPQVQLQKMKSQELKSLRTNFQIIDRVIAIFNSIVQQVLILVTTGNILVSRRKKWALLEAYKTLTEQQRDKVQFLGPQPVSMTLNELNIENPHSILSGYVVTEKADGIRAELFIDYGIGYLVTQKLEIIHTGLQFIDKTRDAKTPLLSGQWILDGEYITQNKDGKPINLFMIFDVYYADNGDYPVHPFTMPWMHPDKDTLCRSSILHDFKTKVQMIPAETGSAKSGYMNISSGDTIEQADCMRVEFKVYYEGPKKLKKDKKNPDKYSNLGSMGKVSKKIWSKREKSYEYYIDGLIYLPMYYPINASSSEEIRDSIGKEWPQNYKWKPPSENTIDFKVYYVKDDYKGRSVDKMTSVRINDRVTKCKQLKLLVGYDIKKDDTSDFAMKLLTDRPNYKNNVIPFEPEPGVVNYFCNVPLTRDKILCLKDKTEVQDGFIYEMQYNPDAPSGAQWTPLRARTDKTFPNERRTANSVWQTIQNPVTERMIIGKDIEDIQSEPTEVLGEGSYYVSDELAMDAPLRELHNYIKQKLIAATCAATSGRSVAILDTSIGRGGDVGKYLRCKKPISFLLALDIHADVNKAAKRMYLTSQRPPSVFMQCDTSRNIKNGEGLSAVEEAFKDESLSERNKLLLDMIYDRKKKLPKAFSKIPPLYKGIASKGFDIISSQFSVHYYFKDELTLRSYIQNLDENCKMGGYFIGTCYDGMKVFQQLQNAPDKTNLEMEDEFGQKVYSITKKYDTEDFTYKQTNKEELFGQEIDVYMSSIGQTFTEYLVNFEMFIDIMKEYNFEPVRLEVPKQLSGIFDKKDMSYADGFGGFEKIIDALPSLQSKDADLKKFYPEAMRMTIQKHEKMRLLSSLNNWFVFQKRE